MHHQDDRPTLYMYTQSQRHNMYIDNIAGRSYDILNDVGKERDRERERERGRE